MTEGRFARPGLVYTRLSRGANMIWRKTIILIAALFVGGAAGGSAPALAQTFQNYHCADGTQFIVGFYPLDRRAYLQLDGGAMTLARRLAASGSRYSGRGVTLKITGTGTTLKHARRPATACELT
jgi:membrane-bound inhibitor of C-type lysozyme